MRSHFSFFAAFVLIASAFGGALSVSADEANPAQYVANIRQHVAFLDQASRLAAQRASSDKVRSFAKTQIDSQQAMSKDLRGWEASQPTGGLHSPTIVSSADDGSLPTASDTLMTGRSIAIDDKSDNGVLMASPGVVVIPQLSTLNGKSFDELYEKTQKASLEELKGLYEAYGMTGTDPTLRALALRELPIVKQRLAELGAL